MSVPMHMEAMAAREMRAQQTQLGIEDASDLDVPMDTNVEPASCGQQSGAPSWLEPGTVPHHLVARGTSRDVHVWTMDDGLLRVRYVPSGTTPIERSFALVSPIGEMSAAAHLDIGRSQNGERAWICTDALIAEIERDGMRMTVRDLDGNTLLEDAHEAGRTTANRVSRITPSDELFLGLGERTGPIDARGRHVTMWNTDAYDSSLGGFAPNANPLYLSIPFFIGVRDDVAYGLFTDVAHRLDFDLARAHPERYEIESAGPEIDQWVIAGPTPREILRRYSTLTGRTPMPPRWSLGFHQSRWGYHDASRVLEVASELRHRALPSDALWLDIQHMHDFRTFTFDPVRFADPEGLAAQLHERGFHLVVIADPGFKEDPGWPIYDRAIGERLVLRDASGAPYIDGSWAGRSVFLDFTLPAARTFWAEQVATLGSRGVDGIWLDVNEPTTFPESGGATTIPNHLAIDGDGISTTMAEGHNVYALHQARATFDGLRDAFPERRPFILCRAGYAGIQRHAAVWTGDAPSTWWSLRQVLPMLLGMGLSGVPFVGSDVGGYSGHASAELYARWMSLGAISPFFRAHVTSGVPGQEPWNFGVEVEDISHARIRERYALLPYLESLWDEHAESGAPLLRAMAFEYFEDRALRRVDDQVMLGPWLLVAPLLDEGATEREVRLPEGRWYELDSGAIWDGPATIRVNATLAALPTFVREGAILPRTNGDVAHTGELRRDALRIDLYPATRETSFTLYEDAGEGYGPHARIPLSLMRTDSGARLTFGPREGTFDPGERFIELRLWRADGEVRDVRHIGPAMSIDTLARRSSLDALESGGKGYFYDENERSLIVRVRDPGASGAVIELDYENEIIELRPTIEIDIEVEVPEGTPTESTIHIASDANGWTHQPLTWITPRRARGTLRVPRGSWFFYKFTRGSWENVEKWPGCIEANNRYGFGRAGLREDRVWEWRDICE